MKQHKKIHFIFVMLLSIFLMTCLTACSKTTKADLTGITRAEWIELLADSLSLEGQTDSKAYFSDVTTKASYYDAVQACSDWGILSVDKSGKFEPDAQATVSFAIETAILASGIDTGKASYIEYAVNDGIISDDAYLTVNGGLSVEKAEEIAQWSQILALSLEVEERYEVKLNEEVADLTDNKALKLEDSEDTYLISADKASSITVGSVFIAPGDSESPQGYAKKVTSIVNNSDGTITVHTGTPDITEVLDELHVACNLVPDDSMLVLPEGVSVLKSSSIGNMVAYTPIAEIHNALLPNSINMKNKQLSGTAGFNTTLTVELSSKVSSIKTNAAWNATLADCDNLSYSDSYSATTKLEGLQGGSSLPDKSIMSSAKFDNSDAINSYLGGKMSLAELKSKLDETKTKTVDNAKSDVSKYTSGWKLTGTVAIRDFSVTPIIDYKAGWFDVPYGLNSASLKINMEVDSKLKLEGSYYGEIYIGGFNIEIPYTCLLVPVKIYAFVDINGDITVSAKLINNVEYIYDGKKTKTNKYKEASAEAEFNASAEFGFVTKANLIIYGMDWFPLLDTSIKASILFEADGTAELTTNYEETAEGLLLTRSSSYGCKVYGYVPLLSFSVGQEGLLKAVKLSKTFVLIDKEHAYKFTIHEGEKTEIWKETWLIPSDIENAINPEDMKKTQFLRATTGFVTLENTGLCYKIEMSSIPEGYSLSDLVWKSDDSSIATVSNGEVTAISPGITTIIISTADGEYNCYCTIYIYGPDFNYNTFGDEL